MIPRSRPGLSRLQLVLIVVGGFVFLGFITFLVQVWGFYQVLKRGDTALLSSFQFTKNFSPAANETTNTSADAAALSALNSADDPTLGNEDAPLKVTEFVDFSCVYSKEESSVLREVAAAHPELLRIQLRDFPMDELHADARLAAEAASCAHSQGKFWVYHDKLFANQDRQKKEDLLRYALEAGLDSEAFAACLNSGTQKAEVGQDYQVGTALGVSGTPTFFINNVKIEGAIPAEAWQKIISLTQRK